MKYRIVWILFAVALLALQVSAQTNAVPEITTAASDLTLTWDLVKAPMIAIGLFMLGFGLFKRMRRA